jgi:hypothetical protein
MSSLADFQGTKKEVKLNEPDGCDDDQSFISTSGTAKMPTRRQKKAQAE